MLSAPSFDWYLVALSAVVSFCSVYVSLDLASRALRHSLVHRWGFVATSALALGGGLWALQLVGMISFRFPMQAVNSVPSLVLTAGCSFGGALIAIWGLTRSNLSGWRIAFLIGVSVLVILAGHWWTLATLVSESVLAYNPSYLLVAAIVASIGGRTVGNAMLDRTSGRLRAVATFAIGGAMCALFYSSIAGVTLNDPGFPRGVDDDQDALSIALIVAIAIFVILFIGMIAASFDRSYEESVLSTSREVRRSREFAALLVESSAEGIIATDQNGVVTVWNPAVEKLLGIASSEALGRPLYSFADRDFSIVFTPLFSALEGEEAVIECNISTTGIEAHLVSQSTVMRGEDGSLRGGLLFVRDETEFLKMRDQRRQTQKLEALGQLTAGIVHDFNNLLTTVTGNVQMIERAGPEPKRLNAIKQAIANGRDLIDRLLVFARKSSREPVVLDPAERVFGMEQILSASAPRPHEIDMSDVGSSGLVNVNPSDFQVAVLNLVNNARDAMAEGGVISIAVREAVLPGEEDFAPGTPPGRYVHVSVTDTGAGMTESTRSRVFEPFFTTKEEGKGSGLGLSQVYGFARQSGGSAHVETTLGSGTTVHLLLPVVEDRRSASSSAAAAAPEQTALPLTPQILVVDADASRAAATAIALASVGADPTTAESLDEGLRLLDDGDKPFAGVVLAIDGGPERVQMVTDKFMRVSGGAPLYVCAPADAIGLEQDVRVVSLPLDRKVAIGVVTQARQMAPST